MRQDKLNDLKERGIYKHERVFSNCLADMPKYLDPIHTKNPSKCPPEEHGLPEFVVRCLRKIEEMVSTVGVYRINGDAAAVQAIR